VVFHALNGARVAALTLGYGVRHSGRSVALVITGSAGLAALAGWGILFR
jgi:succinate dehydrogenase/fumarate reductase cytochrome b subunit